MSPRWRYFFPGYLMALPHTLVGLLLAVVYRAHSFRWSDGCIEAIGGTFVDDNGRIETRIWGRPGAQTHGFIILYAEERQRRRIDLRVHERVHVVQGLCGGPLYVLAYGACFLFWFLVGGCRDWRKAYLRNIFERHAYSIGDRGKGWGA